MAYEFTRQKIWAERKALAKRLGFAGVAGCMGFALGVAVNDMHSMIGMFSASVVATAAGFAAFYLSADR